MLPCPLAGSKVAPGPADIDTEIRSSGFMQHILVIRFSSLGDLCLLGAALARLADRPGAGERHVTLVTKSAFAPLLARMRGIDRVIGLDGGGPRGLGDLAGKLQGGNWDLVIDAHNTLRSHLLLGLLGRRPDARLAKDTLPRLAFLQFRQASRALERSMSDRFDELFATAAAARVPPASAPRFTPAFRDPGPAPAANQPVLGVAPGAQWPSKQWPQERFAELLTFFREQSNAPIRVFLGPREQEWFPGGTLERTLADLGAVEIVRERPLTELVPAIRGCSLLVTNDSGLLHLAEAAATPVVALYGPTVREFGYFPRHPASRVLEIPLACRPCSRNGKRECHRGDLACLTRIPAGDVLAAVRDVIAWPPAAAGRIEL